jgi:hypothetical protein
MNAEGRPASRPTTTTAFEDDHPKGNPSVRRCPRGYAVAGGRIVHALLNEPTSERDWAEAIRLGYVRDRRGCERTAAW